MSKSVRGSEHRNEWLSKSVSKVVLNSSLIFSLSHSLTVVVELLVGELRGGEWNMADMN